MSEDPYARSDYRRLIAWESRIKREGPYLAELLERAPDRSALDVGCGTGEHVAFFAGLDARAVGLDRSEKMIEQARDHESGGAARFFLGDARKAREALADEPPFGLCICLGNMLPHVLEDDELSALFREGRELLAPGGLFLAQILNYRRILGQGVRHLPLNFRSGEDCEEIVFLRLLKPAENGRILFFPTTLSLDPESEDEPVSIKATRRVELRAWTAEDLVPMLVASGFRVDLRGDMRGGEYDARRSSDLVFVAKRLR